MEVMFYDFVIYTLVMQYLLHNLLTFFGEVNCKRQSNPRLVPSFLIGVPFDTLEAEAAHHIHQL